MRRKIQLIIVFTVCYLLSIAQIKTIIEDFEGYSDGQTKFQKEGIFCYGDISIMTEQKVTGGHGYSGLRALKVTFENDLSYGGWGKGLGLFKELNKNTDYFNFYILSPLSNKKVTKIQIIIEDDDNNTTTFEPSADDQWCYDTEIIPSENWQLLSIPLSNFYLSNKGGDGIFNVNHQDGRLLTINFNFKNTEQYHPCHSLYFDFISFSKGQFNTQNIFDLPKAKPEDYCIFGFWSEEGKSGDPQDIHLAFEKLNECLMPGKIGVVSFYKPFSIDGKKQPNLFPEIDKINKLISNGYLPMITFEAHHKSDFPNDEQPNLYSIIEGWFDHYFAEWAKIISKAEGTVLLRILHEFNGNWYPWCIPNNNQDPDLYIKAYKHIVDIFKKNNANNVKFIWCPNSISTPQEGWNFILNAYPGNDYVDFTGLDIFNGTGQEGIPQWRSFRHEAIDNYFLITENFPDKPLLICETACRERLSEESGYYTTKSDWIRSQAEALKYDMSKFRLITWFNETTPFRVNSSHLSFGAFFKYFWMDPFFRFPASVLIKK